MINFTYRYDSDPSLTFLDSLIEYGLVRHIDFEYYSLLDNVRSLVIFDNRYSFLATLIFGDKWSFE